MNKDSTRREITELPDYPTVKKLAAALWQQDTSYHGAAIMIGAGFSRIAAKTGDVSKKLPLWADLSSALEQDLSSSDSTDPLRLAEEYFAFFGKQALHDLIKKEVNDAAWIPGDMFKTLLELPWSEVLTTNWDTLIERAAMEVHQPVYSVVSRQEELASASAPRIVKLHGTINVTEDLVFTQEDYRRYPQKHAAFVNFTRQVFIENELCLLGFSGEDPNFLQWCGWVRDNLTTHARRIYLVGALQLTSAKRKYLESMNIAPVDLWNLVSEYDNHDTRHAKATEEFLKTLNNLKPKQSWEWSTTRLLRSTVKMEEHNKTTRDPSYAASLLERQIPILASDRESYPGWLVCPSGKRWQLQTQLEDPYPNHQNISRLAPDSRAKLLYEIAWRHSLTYEVTPPWLVQEFLKFCDPASPCILSKKQQLEIALQVIKSVRWFDNGSEDVSIERAATTILRNNVCYWPESADELIFHQAIMARDRFDYQGIERTIDKISGVDPVCKLKKAALLAELGRFDEGETLIAEAYRELLGHYRNNRNSIYVLSRLAWAHWLLRGAQMPNSDKPFEIFPSSYKEWLCDPWDHIADIKETISKAIDQQQKQQVIEPLFEPGHYKDNSNSVTFSNVIHPILLIEGVSNSTGMPLRWDIVSFLVEPASRLVGLNDVDDMHRFSLAIRTADSGTADVLEKVFSRIQVARIPQNQAGHLLDLCIEAIKYWTTQRSTGTQAQQGHALGRLRVFIEVLARLLVRATPEQAQNAFRLAMELGKIVSLRHIFLFDELRHLIQYALESIPDLQHHVLLLDALQFPLQVEIEIPGHREWPNPVITHPGKRHLNTALERRIDEIIDRIEPCSPASAPALLRLLPLIEGDFLTGKEKQKIAEKIWGVTPDYQIVPETGLLKCVLLQLPSPNHRATRVLVRNSLFERKDATLFEPSLMMDIAKAAQAEKIKELPNKDQAIDYFNRLTIWRSKNNNKDPFGFSDQEVKRKGELIGCALAQSIVPALPPQALTEENFNRLYSFYSEVDSPAAVIALIYFININKILNKNIEKIIIRGLQDQNSNKVANSAFALLKLREI